MQPSIPSLSKLPSHELEALLLKARRECWYRGRQHMAVLNSDQKRIQEVYDKFIDPTFAVECCRQIGKTYWASFLADKVARKYSGCQIRLGTAFQVDIEPIIVPNYKKVLVTCPEELQPHFKAAKSTYEYENGSQVVLVGLDKNPDKLRGNRILLTIIEEAGFVDSDTLEYILDSVIAGAQIREPNARTILISTPPREGQDHYFCEVADKMNIIGSYIKITIDESGLPKEAVESFAKKLGGRDTVAFRREGLCERIVDDEQALVREWADDYAKVIPKDEYYNYYYKLVGQDLGRKDHTALVFGYYDFKRAALIIEDELTMDGPSWTTVTLKEEIKKIEARLWGEPRPFRRVSDNNNPHLLQDLASLHDMHFMAVKKDSSLEQMVNRVREWVKDGRIIINPRCKMLIGCLKYGIWDKNRKEFSRSKVYGHYDHLAALMYLLIHTPYSSNPIPRDHGFVNHKAWLGNIKQQKTNNAEVFGKLLGPKKGKTHE